MTDEPQPKETKRPKSSRAAQAWTFIVGSGGLVGLVALFVTIGPFWDGRDDADGGSSQPSTVAPSMSSTTPAPDRAPTSAPPTSATSTSTTSLSPPAPSAGAAPAVTQTPAATTIVVETKLGEPVMVGRKLGLNKYGLDADGEAGVTYKWTAYSPTGVKMDDSDCQMTVTITGPQSFPPYLTANCSERYATSFNGGETGLGITVPGTYTVSVEDELTGAVGTISFEVAR